jgi:hypothetical protein
MQERREREWANRREGDKDGRAKNSARQGSCYSHALFRAGFEPRRGGGTAFRVDNLLSRDLDSMLG